MFHESLDEIQDEMFADDGAADASTFRAMMAPGGGFHVERGAATRRDSNSRYRTDYKRLHDKVKQETRIRAALLAGESPKVYSTPTRWFTVAKAMGIDLMARADPKFAAHWNKDGGR